MPPMLTWPPRREDLARLARSYSERQIARLYGRSRAAVRKWLAKYGLKTNGGNGGQAADEPAPRMRDLEAKVLALLRRQPMSEEELANALDRGPQSIAVALDGLRLDGYPLVRLGERWALEREPAPAETATELPAPAEGVLRVGLVGDTHLGSKAQQLTYLRETYARFEDAGVQVIYHLGDVLDGVDVYRGQHAEQWLHTYDEQVDYAAEVYPKASVPTRIIGGNHDLAALRRGDGDPLRRLCQERPDLEYLGPYSAWPSLDRLLMYLLHPQGGGAYAISYKLQKIVESFEGGRKPHILVAGHWHQMAYVHVRNVHALYPGCFQAQTEFQRRLALQPQVGAVLLEIRLAEDGAWHEVTPRFIRYFVPRERDY